MHRQLRLTNVYIERKKVLGKKVAWASGVTILEAKDNELVDILFVNNLPLWKNVNLPYIMDVTIEIRESKRNKRGARVLHAIKCHSIKTLKVEKKSDTNDDEDDIKHSLNDKTQRNENFANFIVNTFTREFPSLNLSSGNGIFDIAGGRGDLCRELLKYADIVKKVSLIDPRALMKCNNNDKWKTNSIKDICFKYFQCEFNRQFINNNREFLSQCSMFVGMHPDQPTELIIDCAFEMNKPFCVVPCCVYPSLFPDRKISTGQGVKKYNSFIRYLLEKDDSIQSKELNFQGRNIVLYWFPPAVHNIEKRNNKRKLITTNESNEEEKKYKKKQKL